MTESKHQGIDESAGLRWGKSPSGISLPARIGVGSDLVQSLDYVVILQCLFSVTEGSSPTPPMVWEALKARGIRSAKNVNELVGKNAVYESFTRLIGAGYIRRVEIPNEQPGRRPKIGYDVFDDPSGNPDWQAAQVAVTWEVPQQGQEEPQVSPLPGTPEMVKPQNGYSDISAGQPTSRNAGSGNVASGVPGSGVRRIPAGQSTSLVPGSGRPSPPHTPPGGLVNPPTVPPRSTNPESVVAAVAGGNTMRTAQNTNPDGVQELTETELHAAGEFLADLPGRWACGLQDVEKYARQLAEAAKRQGWPLNAEFERWLTADDRSIRGAYPRVIPARLKNLPRYSAWRRAGLPTGTAAKRGPVEDACPNHPHRAAVDCVPCRDPADQEQKPAERPGEPVRAEVIAAARAFVQVGKGVGKGSGRQREKTPHGDARARRQAAGSRSAAAEAEAEENRRKAAALLQQDAAAALGLPTVPAQAHQQPAAQ